METIANFFKVIAAFLGWSTQRDSEKNAPDVRKAAVAQQEQSQVDRTNTAIKKNDVTEIRKELAE